ncbi:MAG: heavy-metal-associated domain-containing protein [Planctomycetes bacterium]|nr:heavy-metal-associated domain-containing protein [Planctomycetota bacterium]
MNVFRLNLLFVALIAGCLIATGCKNDGEVDRDNEGSGNNEQRQVTLKVQGLDSENSESAVREILDSQSGVSSVSVDLAATQVSFLLDSSGSVDKVVGALEEAGYEAEEPADSSDSEDAEHPENSSDSEHPEHPENSSDSSDSEHPEHPENSSDSEHPEHPEHPENSSGS